MLIIIDCDHIHNMLRMRFRSHWLDHWHGLRFFFVFGTKHFLLFQTEAILFHFFYRGAF